MYVSSVKNFREVSEIHKLLNVKFTFTDSEFISKITASCFEANTNKPNLVLLEFINHSRSHFIMCSDQFGLTL